MPTILVADDSLFQRHLIGKIARDLGFTVLEAKTGQECLNLAIQKTPDAILLDLNMPEKTGFEVLQGLRDAGHRSPVIVLTADIQETSRQRCLNLGVSDFLNKPVDETQLRSLLQGLHG
jgi:CheY-like chemotaxis protein